MPKCKLSPSGTAIAESPRVIQKVVTYYECGIQEHYKKDFPKLKNKNQGNQAGNNGAQARAYDLGGNKPNQIRTSLWKKTEDKSEEKQLEDVQIVRDFLE
ncbi:hypothetical protein Tco_1270441, partial [Tanacetum coccineum]